MVGSKFIHPSSEVRTTDVGEKLTIWQYVVVGADVSIGSNVNICSHCFIEDGVIIGNNVTIKNGNYIYCGVIIEDDVFIGPNVTFTNDKYPKSKMHQDIYPKILIKKGSSIGAGSVLLPGITIGENTLIGAGSLVCSDVPDNIIFKNKRTNISTKEK